MKVWECTGSEMYLNLVQSTQQTLGLGYGSWFRGKTSIILHHHICEARISICTSEYTLSY